MSALARNALLAAALSILMFAGAAGAAAPQPTLEVTSPADGSTFSRSAGPIPVAGDVGFAEPAPSSRNLYLRYTAGCGVRYTSETDGPDAGNSCQGQTAILTLAGQSFTRDFPADPAEVELPITIDASRNITGQMHINSETLGVGTPANWVQLDVVVRLGSTSLTQSFDSGPYTGARTTFTLDLDVPASLDKVDINEASVDLVWHRVIHLPNGAYHTYVELDDPASFVTIPSYTTSFSRKVELKVDNPSFGSGTVQGTVDLEAGTFTASVPVATVALGGHFLYVRAVQGAGVSPTRTLVFHLTA